MNQADLEAAPLTAALFGRITSLRHATNVDAAYECRSGVDRCHECCEDFDVLSEARRSLIAELRAGVEGIKPCDFDTGHAPSGWFYDGFYEARIAVLALLDMADGKEEALP